MKSWILKNGRRWSMYAAVLSTMVYAALMLNSQPAYAVTCNCTKDDAACYMMCETNGGIQFVVCPLDNNTKYGCKCRFIPEEIILPC
jgi:hypothetical protein